jgi:LPS-assembly lipoprotein
MKRVLGFACVVSVAASLGACGFHPLYATGPSGNEGMTQYYQQVLVEPIQGRQGVHLRNQLMDVFTPGGTPTSAAYRLSIRLEEQKEGLAIQQDTRITRYNYNLTAKYELKDAVSGQILDKGISRSIAPYNVVDSQFATLSAERDAQERAAREVGEDIRVRLGLYFEQHFNKS